MEKKQKLHDLLDENPELYHDIDVLHEKVGYTQKHYTERYADEWKNLNPGKVPDKEDTNETMNEDNETTESNEVSEKAVEKLKQLSEQQEQQEQHDEPETEKETQQKDTTENTFQEQLRIKRETNGKVEVGNSKEGHKDAKPEQPGFIDTDKSTDEIINEAETQEEKERRNEFIEDLERKTKTKRDTPQDPEREYIEIDEDLAKQLIGMPFSILNGIDSWDGWELSETEKKTNAKLFVKYAEERGIPMTASTLFFLSMGATFGTRLTMRANHYRKNKKSNTSSKDFGGEPPPEQSNEDETNDGNTFDPENPDTWG